MRFRQSDVESPAVERKTAVGEGEVRQVIQWVT
jgi:hypothetical protein